MTTRYRITLRRAISTEVVVEAEDGARSRLLRRYRSMDGDQLHDFALANGDIVLDTTTVVKVERA